MAAKSIANLALINPRHGLTIWNSDTQAAC
jgi:hypothetical protein